MDNGKEFTDRLFGLRKRAQSGQHEFGMLCTDLDIEHRLTPPRSPQTNGPPLGDCGQSPAEQTGGAV
jgi:transposase InsO family protein